MAAVCRNGSGNLLAEHGTIVHQKISCHTFCNQNEENFPLTQSVEEKSCETLLPLMESDEVPFLTQTEECWQENIDWMSESGLIDKKVDVSDVMVNLQE